MSDRKILCIGDVSDQDFWRVPSSLIEKLQQRYSAELAIQVATDGKEFMGMARQAHYIFGFPFPANVVRRNPNLEWVHFFTSQVPSSWDKLKGDLQVTDSCGINAESVVDHGMYLIYRALRGEPCHQRYNPIEPSAFQVAHNPKSKNMGIVGAGAIGASLAKRCVGLFQQVNVMSRSGTEVEGAKSFTCSQLDVFLQSSDYIVMALPLSPESYALFDAEFFYQLRPGATLINLARGELLDEEKLLEKLRSDELFRYLTDVTNPEPYPMDGPLMQSDRVFITPHIGGRRDDIWSGLTQRVLELAQEKF